MTVNRQYEQVADKRPVWPAIVKGLKNRCPRCGEGNLFGNWLKVIPQCKVCKQELHHERAQDFPPYIVIMIVGHIVVTAVMMVEANFDWSLQTHLLVWLPITLGLSLVLMQPIKGSVVGLQWALKMFGFDESQNQ